MLPLHPQPIPGEILSSWMIRLAFANGWRLHTFYSGLLQYKSPIWNRDVDRHPPDALFNCLQLHTGVSEIRLRSLALSSFDGVLFESPTISTNSTVILPLGIRHRIHRRSGMQFCPLCLGEDAVPYYRKAWRLACNVICTKHNCVMEESCPKCSSPIAFHRHGIGRRRLIVQKAFLYCSQCGFDLRLTSPTTLIWKDRRSLAVLKKISDAENRPQMNCGAYIFPLDVPFFKGLYVLLNLLHGRQAHRILPYILNKIGDEEKSHTSRARSEFEYLCVLDRLQLMKQAAWLLVDWPERFIKACRHGGLTRSRIFEMPALLPFWLLDVVDQHFDNRLYIPSSSEIEDAASYLIKIDQKVNVETLGRIFGLGYEATKNALLRKGAVWKQTKISRVIRD